MATRPKTRAEARQRRRLRIRRRLSGTAQRPRISVFRSHQHTYAQIIRDDSGHTLVAASTLDPELRGKFKSTKSVEAAYAVGLLLGRRAKEAGLTEVVFDRGGYPYHGRVKAVAEGAREAGLKF